MNEVSPRRPAVDRSGPTRAATESNRRTVGALVSSAIVSTIVVVGYFVLPLSSALTTTTGLVLAGGLLAVTLLLIWHMRSIIRSPYPRVRAVAALATTVPVFLVVF